MKTVINVKQLLLATAFLFCAALLSPLSAQTSSQRSELPTNVDAIRLTDAEMNGLHPTDYNKAVILYYIKTQLGVSVGSEKPGKDRNSMEARIAITLVKALSDKDRGSIEHNLKVAGGEKTNTQQSLFPVSCGGLNYPEMWKYLGACV